MNEISVTWDLIGKVGAILAVIVGIVKAVQYLYALTPSSNLDKRVSKLEENQKKDFDHLKEIDERISALQAKTESTQMQLKELNEGIQQIGKSQISMLRHMANGNGTEYLNKEADELTDYFIKR